MVPKDLPNAPKRRRNRVLRRRRQTFERLVLAAVSTFVLGLVPALRELLLLHLVVDVVLVAYTVQLRRWRIEETRRKHVARDHSASPQPEPSPSVEEPIADDVEPFEPRRRSG